MNLSKNNMVDIYEVMILIRKFEERLVKCFLDGSLAGYVHPYNGQEAIAAGVCANLKISDYITSNHRGHGHVIAKGSNVKYIMAELFGKVTGYCNGRGGSMHVTDISMGVIGQNGIVGASMPIALGAGFACKYKNSDNVSVAFFGDGAANRGTFHEALNLAAAFNLPVIFVCENNLYGATTHQSITSRIKDIGVRSTAYGIPGDIVNGNDVLEVYEASKRAIELARKGEGPSLLEFKTWRQKGHFIVEAVRYRNSKEHMDWLKKDPILAYEKNLISMNVVSKSELDSINERVDEIVENAVKFAVDSAYPDVCDILKHVYYEG